MNAPLPNGQSVRVINRLSAMYDAVGTVQSRDGLLDQYAVLLTSARWRGRFTFRADELAAIEPAPYNATLWHDGPNGWVVSFPTGNGGERDFPAYGLVDESRLDQSCGYECVAQRRVRRAGFTGAVVLRIGDVTHNDA